jgi:hypothetical protein
MSSTNIDSASRSAIKTEVTTTESESTRSHPSSERLLTELAKGLQDSLLGEDGMPVASCNRAASANSIDSAGLSRKSCSAAGDDQQNISQEDATPSRQYSRWWEMPLDHIKSVRKRNVKNCLASSSPPRKLPRCELGGTTETHCSHTNPAGVDEDDWMTKLMKRRAERNAPEPSKLDDENLEGVAKASATKAAKKAARLCAVESIQSQLSELARVRAAAEAAGWEAGFADEPHTLEHAPPAPSSAMSCINRTARSRRGTGNDAAGPRPDLSSVELTKVLPTIQLPVDVACAAEASDAFHAEHRALLIDAARAHRRSRGESRETEQEAFAVLRHLQQRAKEEPGRRALMRSYGVCPHAAISERASIGRSGEGRLPSRTIANEFEAKTFLPSAHLCERIEAVRPGYLGEWHQLDEGQVALISQFSGPKDFAACAEAAGKIGAHVTGVFVGRLASAGLTHEYPFFIKSGLTHYVCGACEKWVSRQEARLHNMRCVGDAGGRARIFHQPCGESLGFTLSFKHLAKQGMVELQAEAAIDAAIRRACWACYWSPDDVCCAWRLTRNRCRKSNTFPTSGPVEFSKHKTSENYVPTAIDDKEELDTAKMSLEN